MAGRQAGETGSPGGGDSSLFGDGSILSLIGFSRDSVLLEG